MLRMTCSILAASACTLAACSSDREYSDQYDTRADSHRSDTRSYDSRYQYGDRRDEVRFDANGVDINHPQPGYQEGYQPRDRSRDADWQASNDRGRYNNNSGQYDPNNRGDMNRSDSNRSMTGASAWSTMTPDARILSSLHAIDREEIDMGRLAKEKGSSSQIRDFGDRMVRDHSDHDSQVLAVARSANITLMEPEQLKREHMEHMDQMKTDSANTDARWSRSDSDAARDGMRDGSKMDHMSKLNSLSGEEFDRAFARHMIQGHKKAIAKVEDARSRVTNSEVRDLLDKTLPKLREHLEQAEKLPNAKD